MLATISNFLRQPDCPLKILYLNGCDLDDHDHTLITFINYHYATLQTIKLGANKLGNTIIQAIINNLSDKSGNLIQKENDFVIHPDEKPPTTL